MADTLYSMDGFHFRAVGPCLISSKTGTRVPNPEGIPSSSPGLAAKRPTLGIATRKQPQPQRGCSKAMRLGFTSHPSYPCSSVSICGCRTETIPTKIRRKRDTRHKTHKPALLQGGTGYRSVVVGNLPAISGISNPFGNPKFSQIGSCESGAGEGNRTLVSGLGSPHSTIGPHPHP